MSYMRLPRTTPNLGLPIPGDEDLPDGVTGIGDLADAIDGLREHGTPGPQGPAGPLKWWAGTQAAFGALPSTDPARLYMITDAVDPPQGSN